MTIDVSNECPPHDPEDIWKRVWTCKRCGFTGIKPKTKSSLPTWAIESLPIIGMDESSHSGGWD